MPYSRDGAAIIKSATMFFMRYKTTLVIGAPTSHVSEGRLRVDALFRLAQSSHVPETSTRARKGCPDGTPVPVIARLISTSRPLRITSLHDSILLDSLAVPAACCIEGGVFMAPGNDPISTISEWLTWAAQKRSSGKKVGGCSVSSETLLCEAACSAWRWASSLGRPSGESSARCIRHPNAPDSFVHRPLGFLEQFVDLSGHAYATLAEAKLRVSHGHSGVFFDALSDFLIVAFVVFLLVRQVNRLKSEGRAVPTRMRGCPFCFSTFAIKAPHCRIHLCLDGGFGFGVNTFHEKAGRSQVSSFVFSGQGFASAELPLSPPFHPHSSLSDYSLGASRRPCLAGAATCLSTSSVSR